jgi:hypothetical protein
MNKQMLYVSDALTNNVKKFGTPISTTRETHIQSNSWRQRKLRAKRQNRHRDLSVCHSIGLGISLDVSLSDNLVIR